jgi:hypothetical protein
MPVTRDARRRPRSTVRAEHHWPNAPVELQPQPGLGDPGPRPTPMPSACPAFAAATAPAGGALVPTEPEREQPMMGGIRAHAALDSLDSLYDPIGPHHPRNGRSAARRKGSDGCAHGDLGLSAVSDLCVQRRDQLMGHAPKASFVGDAACPRASMRPPDRSVCTRVPPARTHHSR